MSESLTIGGLARAAGVHVETVRYYERTGLIRQPPTPARGYRRYPAAAVARIRFIKRAQALGFTLQEIVELLEIGDGACPDVQAKAQRKRDNVESRIRDLLRLRASLDCLIEACNARGEGDACPLIEALSKDAQD